MSDQMREEFSAWYLAEVTESYGESVRPQAQKNLDWVREDGSFADPMLRLASLAWQASRESLPSLFTAVDMGTAAADGFRDGAASKEKIIDALLNHCEDGECHVCSQIICQHGDGMHFHHDGCPSCAQEPSL